MSEPAAGETPSIPPHPTLSRFYGVQSGRRPFVDRLFDGTAGHYDRIGWLMSLGSGPWHRRQALLRAGLRPDMVALDVAVGTGAVARESRGLLRAPGWVVGIDPSIGMLAQAGRLGIPVIQGIAERLPFRDETFDFLSMGYALRHVSDLEIAFHEYHRVLRPGGRLLILDLQRPSTFAARCLADLYFGTIVPWAAQLGSGDREARVLMRYCWATVAHCVPPETIRATIERCGFAETRSKADFGVFIEYLAVKPKR